MAVNKRKQEQEALFDMEHNLPLDWWRAATSSTAHWPKVLKKERRLRLSRVESRKRGQRKRERDARLKKQSAERAVAGDPPADVLAELPVSDEELSVVIPTSPEIPVAQQARWDAERCIADVGPAICMCQPCLQLAVLYSDATWRNSLTEMSPRGETRLLG